MKNERNALKAGLFIVISLVLTVAVIVGIKGVSRFLEPVERYQVRFTLKDDIGGLADGDPVRIGGATVGTVRDIELDTESENPGIVIQFNVPRRYKVRDDAVITIQSTLTGVAVLNIESLGKGAQLQPGQMITGTTGTSFATFTAVAQGFLSDARTITLPKVNNAIDKTTETVETFKGTGQHATSLIKYVRSKVDPIIERYNKVADTGSNALDEIGKLFGDTRPDFRGTVSNLNSITAAFKEKVPGLLEKADGMLAKMNGALDKTNAALEDIKQVAENTRDATGSARSILTANRSKIDNMIASLKTAGDNLKFATAEIRRSPWRLLYKPSNAEMSNLNLYDSARQFAEGANSMSDAAEALRDALKDPDAKPEQIQKLVDELDARFNKFNEVEQELWNKVK